MTDLLLSVAIGVSLAATCGLRAFLPLLLTGLGARQGYVELGDSFLWLQEPPALIALGIATVVEVVADKVPALDSLLDALQTPVRTGAGMLVAGSLSADLPSWAWALVTVGAGGGSAASVHVAKTALRVGSTVATGGLANPLISLAEDALALLASALSILFVVAAVVLALLAMVAMVLVAVWLWRRLNAPPAPAPDPPPPLTTPLPPSEPGA